MIYIQTFINQYVPAASKATFIITLRDEYQTTLTDECDKNTLIDILRDVQKNKTQGGAF